MKACLLSQYANKMAIAADFWNNRKKIFDPVSFKGYG